jgi:hypothetical protein
VDEAAEGCTYSLLLSTSENSTEHRRLVANRNSSSWIDSECFRATTLSFSLIAGNRQYCSVLASEVCASVVVEIM